MADLALMWWACPSCSAETFGIFELPRELPATFTERCTRDGLEVQYQVNSVTIDDGRGEVYPYPWMT